MVTLFKEVTIKGNSYGFTLDKYQRKIYKATRSFLIETNGALDNSLDETLGLLPQKGEEHPFIEYCFVTSVTVNETDDPNINTATVEYETPPLEEGDKVSEDIISFPWEQPPEIGCSSDSSVTQESSMAYTKWPFTDITIPPKEIVSSPREESPAPIIPIVNEPHKEKFSSVGEDPVPCVGYSVSFAIKGFANIDSEIQRKNHDPQLILPLFPDVFTVNNVDINLFGFTIPAYQGYLAEFSVQAKYFISKTRSRYAYYDVHFKILDNSNTWIRRVLNMSMNILKDDTDNPPNKLLTRIRLKDAETGATEVVTDPMLIHPQDGTLLGYHADGSKNPIDTRVYVLPFLTKKPSDWQNLLLLCAQAANR